MPGFTDGEIDTIVWCNYGAVLLNFLGALFTVLTYVAFPGARHEGTTLVFFLAACDLTQSSSMWISFFPRDHANVVCRIQATMLTFGLCGSLAWGLIRGVYLFLVFYKNMDFEQLERYKVIFHFFAWGYAIAGSVAPLAANQYGSLFPRNKYTWCWIADPNSKYRLVLYVPDSTIYVALVILYCTLLYHIYYRENMASTIICKKMRIYLLTYVLINTFAIINRLQNFVSPNGAVFALYVMQFLTQPMQGFLNAFAYAWNEPVFVEQYKRLFSRLFSHCLRYQTPPTEINTEESRLIVYYDSEP